jgi:hypothetical protein
VNVCEPDGYPEGDGAGIVTKEHPPSPAYLEATPLRTGCSCIGDQCRNGEYGLARRVAQVNTIFFFLVKGISQESSWPPFISPKAKNMTE